MADHIEDEEVMDTIDDGIVLGHLEEEEDAMKIVPIGLRLAKTRALYSSSHRDQRC